MMTQEVWMKLRSFKPLVETGVPWDEIAREAGVDWRTAKEYLTAPAAPPRYGPGRRRPQMIDPFAGVIDAWIEAEPRIGPPPSTSGQPHRRTASPATTNARRLGNHN